MTVQLIPFLYFRGPEDDYSLAKAIRQKIAP